LVKTTPNPRATKKSREDELPPPPLLLLLLLPPELFPPPELGLPFARVLVSVGEGPDCVGLTVVVNGELVIEVSLAGVGVRVDEMTIVTAEVVACLTTTRAASITAGLRNGILAGRTRCDSKAT
jgi:hypothetical protein